MDACKGITPTIKDDDHLTAVEFMLADKEPGDDGLAMVANNPKSNSPMPQSLHLCED